MLPRSPPIVATRSIRVLIARRTASSAPPPRRRRRVLLPLTLVSIAAVAVGTATAAYQADDHTLRTAIALTGPILSSASDVATNVATNVVRVAQNVLPTSSTSTTDSTKPPSLSRISTNSSSSTPYTARGPPPVTPPAEVPFHHFLDPKAPTTIPQPSNTPLNPPKPTKQTTTTKPNVVPTPPITQEPTKSTPIVDIANPVPTPTKNNVTTKKDTSPQRSLLTTATIVDPAVGSLRDAPTTTPTPLVPFTTTAPIAIAVETLPSAPDQGKLNFTPVPLPTNEIIVPSREKSSSNNLSMKKLFSSLVPSNQKTQQPTTTSFKPAESTPIETESIKEPITKPIIENEPTNPTEKIVSKPDTKITSKPTPIEKNPTSKDEIVTKKDVVLETKNDEKKPTKTSTNILPEKGSVGAKAVEKVASITDLDTIELGGDLLKGLESSIKKCTEIEQLSPWIPRNGSLTSNVGLNERIDWATAVDTSKMDHNAISTFTEYLRLLFDIHMRTTSLEFADLQVKHAEIMEGINKFYASEIKNSLDEQSKSLEAQYKEEIRQRILEAEDERLRELSHLLVKMRHLQMVYAGTIERINGALASDKLTAAAHCLRDAISTEHQRPLNQEFKVLRSALEELPVYDNLIDGIPTRSINHGVKSFQQLRREFTELESRVRTVQLMPDYGGPLSYILSRAMSPFIFKMEGFVPGSDVQAVLSRTRYFLDQGDLEKATWQLNSLTGYPRKVAQDWLNSARSRLEVLQVLDVLETHLDLHATGAL